MASSTAAPRGGWYHGWNIVAVCILSQIAANGLTYNSYSLFLNDWAQDLHSLKSQMQLPIVAMGFFSALTSPIVGTWADKFSPRKLFAVGLLGMAAFYLAVSFVTRPWQLIALYGLLVPFALGLSTALVANSVIARWFVKSRGLALGLSAFGIGMAGVFLPPIIAHLLPEIGWRNIWRAGAAIVAFVVMPIVVAVIRPQPEERDGTAYLQGVGAPSAHAHGHSHGGPSSLTWRSVFGRRNFWLIVAAYLSIMMVQGGISNNLAPLTIAAGYSQQTAGNLLSVINFAHVAATLALGLISDRFGNRLAFCGLAMVVAAGGALVALSTGLPMLTLGVVLAGCGGGVFTLLAAAIAVEFGAEGTGRAFGMAMFFLPIGVFAPFIIARVKETSGSYAPALLALSGLVVLVGLLSLLLREKRGGRRSDEERAAAVDEPVSTPIA